MVGNYYKLLEMTVNGENGCKWQKLMEMAVNDCNDWRLMIMAGNGWTCLEWLEMA